MEPIGEMVHILKSQAMDFLNQLKAKAEECNTQEKYSALEKEIDGVRKKMADIIKIAFNVLADNQEFKIGDKVRAYSDWSSSEKVIGEFQVVGFERGWSKVKPELAKIKKDGNPHSRSVYVNYSRLEKID